MMLNNLAQILRDAGCKVQEEPGWQGRGHGHFKGVRGVLWHHTAGAASGNYPSLNVVKNGRAGLSGPLSNLGLARDGTWIVIAAGVSWHAGTGSYPGIPANQGNYYLIGIEAENTGTGQPWPAVQIDAYRRGTAALLKAYGLGADRTIGHKEWSPRRKIDPAGLDMNAERQHVQNYMNAPSLGDVKGFLMALNDVEQKNVHNWILDIHRFLYHPGHVPNKIDPKVKTRGIDLIADMAKWTQPVLGHAMAARKAAETAAGELTEKRNSRVPGSTVKDDMGGYVANADRYGYENAKRLDEMEAKLDRLLAHLEEQSK